VPGREIATSAVRPQENGQRGFTYTGGFWVSGSTAPLWTLLLAAGHLVVRHVVFAAFFLGFACQSTLRAGSAHTSVP
jgi:hypothetical protein